VKRLWSMVQGDPVFMRQVNGWLTIFWIAMIPVSLAFHWVESVVYVSALSLWALVSGHWSAWQAARVEVKEDEAEDRRKALTETGSWRESSRHTRTRAGRTLRAKEKSHSR